MNSVRSRAESQLDLLIEELHSTRLRVWSIVVSFFGDAITPRGGVLWLSTFRPVAQRLQIESGTLGAAMSRLTADGWLVREKRGRHSLYRLDASGHAVFEQAAQQIYGLPRARAWNGRWRIMVLPEDVSPPAEFMQIDTRTWARPDIGSAAPVPDGAVCFTATTETSPALRYLVDQASQLEPVAAAYERLIVRFSPLLSTLEGGDTLQPLSALAARLLLVHAFRRVVLKDPDLPDSLRWPDWPGFRAREHAARLYRGLLPASEAWLDASDCTPEGALPKPKASFYKRFGGLR